MLNFLILIFLWFSILEWLGLDKEAHDQEDFFAVELSAKVGGQLYNINIMTKKSKGSFVISDDLQE